MKLKTLKDIEFGFGCDEEHDCRDCIKAEAIKWVREEIELYGRKGTASLNRWIKRFDIILKEDLK